MKTFKKYASYALFALILVVFMFVIIMQLLGHKSYAVLSPSMSPTINTNALVYVDVYDDTQKQALVPSDIIAIETGGIPVMHRIVEIKDGKITTKGDANESLDAPITYDKVIGKVIFSIPLIGFFVSSKYVLFVLIGIIGIIATTYYLFLEIKKRKIT
ncbi:MAG: signal peptidase I [Bacteroidales bacterium]|nr:signal peptidase I [Bacteroidales bacterium]